MGCRSERKGLYIDSIMDRKNIDLLLSQTKTFLLGQSVPRVDLLMKQIRLLDRFLKEGRASVSGPSLLYESDGEVHCIAFEKKTVVGRKKDAELFVDAPGLSRSHFSVESIEGEGVVLIDLASKNKTFVNDEMVDRAVLVPGDVINAGDVLFIYLED